MNPKAYLRSHNLKYIVEIPGFWGIGGGLKVYENESQFMGNR